jgi:hypothetical protein
VLHRNVGKTAKQEEQIVAALRVLHEHGTDMNKAPSGFPNESWCAPSTASG